MGRRPLGIENGWRHWAVAIVVIEALRLANSGDDAAENARSWSVCRIGG